MEDTKRRIEPFSLYDHTNIEKHLEKMALKGWMIESIGSTFWKYKKVEPQKLHFSVVYYPKTVNEGVAISEDRQYFIDMCTSNGWKYILNKEQLHIFCSESENTPPIETDPEIQIECIHKFAKSEIIGGYLLLIVACSFVSAFFGYEVWEKPIDKLINDSTIFWHLPVIIMFSVYNIISYCIWYKKAKVAAENGEFTATKKLINIESLFWGPLYFGAVMLYFLTSMRLRYLLFAIGLVVLGIVVYKLIDIARTAINKTEYKKSKKRKLKNLVTFLLIVLFIVSGTSAYFIIPKPYDNVTIEIDNEIKQLKVYHDKGAPLDISDFRNTESKTVSYKKSLDEAIFIKQSEWNIFTVEADDDLFISYTITDVRFTPLFESCKKELEDYNHYMYDCEKIDLNTEYEIFSHITEESKKRNAYVFCDNHRIVQINFSWEPTKEEIIFAADKLMNF